MPNSVLPSRDAYGKEADASAMADYMELVAMRGQFKSKADLADFLLDTTWEPDAKRRPKPRAAEGFRSPGDDDDEPTNQDDAAVHSDRVFRLLLERKAVLGDMYPFDISDDRLHFLGTEPTENHYLGLLAITVAHAYKFTDLPVEPTQVFEETVSRAMAGRFPETANLAANRRGVSGLQAALDAIAGDIKLSPAVSDGSRSSAASDAKVDVISHLWWRDERPAGWVLLGQVTVGQSQTWLDKLMEPPSGSWMKYLSLLCEPIVYLAIPHHIEPLHLYDLMEGYKRVVVDRLRLAAYLEGPSADESTLIAELVDANVQLF